MLRFDIVTVFPQMMRTMVGEGVLGRALERAVVQLGVHDLRDYTSDRHRSVDDVPYGGGPGMVLKAEPFIAAVDAVRGRHGTPGAVALMSPQGRPFSHREALRLSRLRHVVLLCGRYEGVDDRVRDLVASEEISIGDYVLTGGELPAAVVVDAVARLVPGVVGDARSVDDDSFVRGLFDHPHFTRPAAIGAHTVPDVLLSGHHEEIRRWRKREALRRTLARRPDLVESAALDGEDRKMLEDLDSVGEE